TLHAKIRNSKRLQADITEFDKMREDDTRRNLKWLTESIDSLLARDRMEWARKLQRKLLTSGAIDADSAPSMPTTGKGKGKGKPKGKGKGRGKRYSSREPSST
ncbi:MAG: hypothetical protein ACKPKO_62715, partial [Candidatus Fonsibacter sp.]